ncbi:hypothetical protein [Nostoc sp. 2RC]|uniref:hypothetical protein n=1 Tax=Nostoc sp. 2RC TaxID=2485484 RepID=UPI0016235CB3|nr:hypothetical protein [Nostoc sp. 2RC]MBC1235904.1 hypothetical protein [Nostoc sp. 2RC]
MTETSEMKSLRTTSEFLFLIDVMILTKITKSGEYASRLNSQNRLSISIQDSSEIFIIPCFVEIRKMIQKVPEVLQNTNHDAKVACIVLRTLIDMKYNEINNLKQQTIDPTAIAGLSFIQGIYRDIVQEVGCFIYKPE